MADSVSYQGGSAFLRWWPPALLCLAFAVVVFEGFHGLRWATVLVGVSYFHYRCMPWQFAVQKDGVELAFPFGRRAFLPKSSLTVRMESVGATALVGRHRRIGYLLLDSILHVPGRNILMRTAFTGLGYTFV